MIPPISSTPRAILPLKTQSLTVSEGGRTRCCRPLASDSPRAVELAIIDFRAQRSSLHTLTQVRLSANGADLTINPRVTSCNPAGVSPAKRVRLA